MFCLDSYETSGVHGYDEKIGYVSGDRRRYRENIFRLRASTMSMEQFREHCELYAARSSEYVRDS